MVSSRIAIHWPDHHLWAARVFTTRANVLGLNDRYPWAAGVIAVPLTIVGLLGVIMHPFVFVPLLVLAGAALVAVEYFADQQTVDEHRGHLAGGAQERNRRSLSDRASTPAKPNPPQPDWERAQAEAAEARIRAADLWVQAENAEARALAAEARARATRHPRESEADTDRFPRLD